MPAFCLGLTGNESTESSDWGLGLDFAVHGVWSNTEGDFKLEICEKGKKGKDLICLSLSPDGIVRSSPSLNTCQRGLPNFFGTTCGGSQGMQRSSILRVAREDGFGEPQCPLDVGQDTMTRTGFEETTLRQIGNVMHSTNTCAEI